MIRQRQYRPPGSLPNTGTQIDCGIYFYLMVLLQLENFPLSSLTPASVHTFRLHLAHSILHHLLSMDIHVLVHSLPVSILSTVCSYWTPTTVHGIQCLCLASFPCPLDTWLLMTQVFLAMLVIVYIHRVVNSTDVLNNKHAQTTRRRYRLDELSLA